MKRELSKVDKAVGQRVKERRRELQLSQKELAAKLGVSYQQVQKYENGDNRISAGMLYQLSAKLDCRVSDFFDGIDGDLENAEVPSIDPGLDADIKKIARYLRSIGNRDLRRRLIELVRIMSESLAHVTR
ncbi:MAG: helix-turn-helix transcriptional regulator [Alphaproteobacteria bacterium]|nr:helix-turn-helix transcriptional regulator [Alphaproteobacteria bacterium]